MKVYIVVSGDGDWGNEEEIIKVFATKELAEDFRDTYPPGSPGRSNIFIQEHEVHEKVGDKPCPIVSAKHQTEFSSTPTA